MKQLSRIFRKRSTSVETMRGNGYPPNIRDHSRAKHSPMDDDSPRPDRSFSSELTSSSSSSSSPPRPTASPSADLFYENARPGRRSILIQDEEKNDEDRVLKHRAQLVALLAVQHRPFEDETFPPTGQSIFLNGVSFARSTLDFFSLQPLPAADDPSSLAHQPIRWLRPDQIVTSSSHTENNRYQWTVFRDPKPNDVIQGALGDCWFITALSVLAERPDYLTKILLTKEPNPQGIYYVRLCQDGQWQQVLVDDRFPCRKDQKLLFSQSRRKQLWVPLIEKALAKLNGTYESIVAGRCCEGLSIVSGCPCETICLGDTANPDDKSLNLDELWRSLLEVQRRRFLMCAMCANKSIGKDRFDRSGLSNNHAYSVQQFEEFGREKHRMVKLRNPWGGNQRWKGENEPLLRQFGLIDEREMKRKGDGVFWIPFRSFVEYFESVDICKIRPDWYEVRDQGHFPSSSSSSLDAFTFEVKERTEMDLTLHRLVPKNQRFQRSNCSLSLAVVNMEKQANGADRIYSIPILSQRGQHKFICTSGVLGPGTYHLLPFLFDPSSSSSSPPVSFNVSIHSSSPIDLQRCSLPRRLEREYLIKLCLFHGDEVSATDKCRPNMDEQVRVRQLKNFWDGFILLVENRNPTKHCHFVFRCSASQNAHLSRRDGEHQTRDVVPPLHRQIILICSRKNPSHSFTLVHEFHWEMSPQPLLKTPPAQLARLAHWPPIDASADSSDLHLPQRIRSFKQN